MIVMAFENLKEDENTIFDEQGYPLDNKHWKPSYSLKIYNQDYKELLNYNQTYYYERKSVFETGGCARYIYWIRLLKTFSRDYLHCEGLFRELIDILYNGKGIIGSRLAGELYNQFANNYNAAKQYSLTFGEKLDIAFFMAKYMNYMKAFKIASNNGAVLIN